MRRGITGTTLSLALLAAGAAFTSPVLAQQARPAAHAAAAKAEDSPLPTLNMVVPQHDRDAAYAYYRAEIAAGRCPAPLARRGHACGAPAAAKITWRMDQPLPESLASEPLPAALIAKLSPAPAGCQYLRAGNDILVVGLGTRVVRALVVDLSHL